MSHTLVAIDSIERRIHLIRGQRVILDVDLAVIYEIETRKLVQAVKRNNDRFPSDFASQLSRKEEDELLKQAHVSGWGGRRHRHYAFTEHGAVMAANVLRSKQAIKASIFVVRAFVNLKRFLASHKELAEKFAELERTVATHDKAIVSLFDAIRELMSPTPSKTKKIGFDLKNS